MEPAELGEESLFPVRAFLLDESVEPSLLLRFLVLHCLISICQFGGASTEQVRPLIWHLVQGLASSQALWERRHQKQLFLLRFCLPLRDAVELTDDAELCVEDADTGDGVCSCCT
mmetsp:Transcript_2036/g.7296  ORF Transcript_2036/g.7296 Transcript_2036/m.7296 type:complete len:115 (+) Transcript_2036:1577-1921(+)